MPEDVLLQAGWVQGEGTPGTTVGGEAPGLPPASPGSVALPHCLPLGCFLLGAWDS